jgi:hypothetical protein
MTNIEVLEDMLAKIAAHEANPTKVPSPIVTREWAKALSNIVLHLASERM